MSMERKEKMKKKKSAPRLFLVMISACLLLPVGMAACSSDSDDEESVEISLVSTRISGCKETGEDMMSRTSTTHPFGKESIVCQAMDDGCLYIRHENAIYNCEPDKIDITISTERRTIVLTEKEVNPKANCICPYDLECTIGGLTNGEYTLIVYRSDDTSPYAKFSFNYNSDLEIVHNL